MGMVKNISRALLVPLFVALMAAIGCGGGGGGGVTGGTGTETPTTQQGVKPGAKLSPDGVTEKAYARPTQSLIFKILEAACYSGDPQYSWQVNTIPVSGAIYSQFIADQSHIGKKIKAIISCTGGSLDFPEVFVNSGSDYATRNLNNLLQNPVSSGGYGLTVEKTGYNPVFLLTGVSMDIRENSTPEFWSSIGNPNGDFVFAFYESLEQLVINATIKENSVTRGCVKDANGNYNAADCIKIKDVLKFISDYGLSDVYLWPTEGKNLQELNDKAINDLKGNSILSEKFQEKYENSRVARNFRNDMDRRTAILEKRNHYFGNKNHYHRKVA